MKKKIKAWGLVGLVVILVCATIKLPKKATAYLNDCQIKENKFTQGNLSLNFEEDGWQKDKDLVSPGDIYLKAPKVTANPNSTVPCYVYMQVCVPAGYMTRVQTDGLSCDSCKGESRKKKLHQFISFGLGEPQIQEGENSSIWEFKIGKNYKRNNDTYGEDVLNKVLANVNNNLGGWTLHNTDYCQVKEGKVDGYVVYYFRFNGMVVNTKDDRVKKRYAKAYANELLFNDTPPVFNKVRMVNCVEGDIEGDTIKMPIRMFAIQATNIGKKGDNTVNSVPTSSKELKEQCKNALYVYCNQNLDNLKWHPSLRDKDVNQGEQH